MPMAPTTYAEVLARNVRAARSRIDLGQDAVAARMRALGFSAWLRQTVGSTERGRRRPTAEEILGLAFALETTVQRLLTPIGEDKWVELPSGMSVDVNAVVRLVDGSNDGAIEWYGNTPIRTGASLAALEFEAVWPVEGDVSGQPPVAVAVVTSAKGVLAGKRVDGKPPWTFIAGEVEPGETVFDAAGREVKEEAGCVVRMGRIIGQRIHPKTGRLMIYIRAVPTHGTKVINGDEAELSDVRWLSMDEASDLMPDMYGPVREYLTGELGRADS